MLDINLNKSLNDSFLVTIDVEDWFQVENFKQNIPFSSWDSCELRVEKNTHRILDLLDSMKGSKPRAQSLGEEPSTGTPSSQPPTPGIKATFFVLGWIAERIPNLIREIHERGHEVGSHGYDHFLCGKQEVNDFRKDLSESKKLLENITGNPVYGYRAPSFSITNDILSIIEECGFLYDSSYNSFSINQRYGKIHLNGNGKNGISYKIYPKFYELPISNLRVGKIILPWGGGGYFRMIPPWVFKKGARAILKNQSGYLFYLHPWEIDPYQPTIKDAGLLYRVRHYTNLKKTMTKLSNFINHFKDCEFLTCQQYLRKVEEKDELA